MSFETQTILLADMDWMEVIWPILLMAAYGIAALVKMFSERSKQKSRETEENLQTALTESSDKPRYKPLDAVSRPRPETPQARTLPYARSAAKASSSAGESLPVAQPASPMSEWDRRQEIKRRRLEQIEALRRQQVLEQQRRQIRQQAAYQDQREQQQRQQQMRQQRQVTQPMPSQQVRASHVSAAARPAATVRKTPQEALRQVRTGQPVGGVSRHSVLKSPLSASAQRTAQAAKDALRSETPTSVPATLRAMLRNRDSLRSAFVLKEILDVPVGLRNP